MNGIMGFEHLNIKMLKSLDEVLRCPICSEFFNSCVMTSCGHDFCSVCIKRRMTTEPDCPICYEDLRERDLRINDSMDKIVRIYKKLTRLNTGQSSKSCTQRTGTQDSSINSSLTQDNSEVQNTSPVQSSSEGTIPIKNMSRTQSTPVIHTIQPLLTELNSPIKIEITDCDDIQEDINVVSTSNRTASFCSTNVSSHKRKSLDTCEVDNQNLGRGHRIKKRSSRYNLENYTEFSSRSTVVDLNRLAAHSSQSCESSVSDTYSDQLPSLYILSEENQSSVPDCSDNELAENRIQNVQTSQLLRDIALIKTTLVKHGEQMNSITVAMNKLLNQATLQTSNIQYDKNLPVQLPIRRYEDLMDLENKLCDEGMQESLCSSLAKIGGLNITNNVKRILTTLISNEVAMHFSWMGAREKEPFIQLKMKKVIFDAVRRNENFKEVQDCALEIIIKDWLRHAKARFHNEIQRTYDNVT